VNLLIERARKLAETEEKKRNAPFMEVNPLIKRHTTKNQERNVEKQAETSGDQE
jgi:hypothetical protein